MIYSVVIPAFNAAETIEEAVQSVLDQTIAPQEMILVDDGSTDGTAKIVASLDPRVRVISQINAGPGAATSAGMAAATSPFIALLDADDIWLPNKTEIQYSAIKKHPNASLFYTEQRQFLHGEPQRKLGEIRSGQNRSSLLMRRAVFETIGDVIDPIGGRGDMVDWLARAAEGGFRSHMIHEVLCLRRIIPTSMSYGRDPEKDRGYLQVAHRAMQRHKARQEQNP